MSNSPSLVEFKNSVQVAELKTRAGPDGSLLSRTATAALRIATSTQLLPPLPLLRLLFFQPAESCRPAETCRPAESVQTAASVQTATSFQTAASFRTAASFQTAELRWCV